MSRPSAEAEPVSGFLAIKALVADGLSLIRALLTVPVLLFSLMGVWGLAFITLVVAWSTDLLDGRAARRWGSTRDLYPKLDVDGIADSVLAFGSSLVPIIYFWAHSESKIEIALTVLASQIYLASIIVAILMIRWLETKSSARRTDSIVAVNMIFFHAVLQIGFTTVWFAGMAFGWLAILPTLIALMVVAAKQKEKFLKWTSGRL